MLRSVSVASGRITARRRVAKMAATSNTRLLPSSSVAKGSQSRATAILGSCRLNSGSSLSSFAEPATLFPPGSIEPLSGTSSTSTKDKDAPLRADVRTMGSLLGAIIKDHHGEAIFDKIEELRALAKSWREAGAGRNVAKKEEAAKILNELSDVCSQLSNEELRIVARAFTHFLAIANAAEGHHRSRLIDQTEMAVALPKKTDSCGGVLQNLLDEGKSPDEIYESLTTQCVELVLTAHPTEVNRRTILEKQRRVQKVCMQCDPPPMLVIECPIFTQTFFCLVHYLDFDKG